MDILRGGNNYEACFEKRNNQKLRFSFRVIIIEIKKNKKLLIKIFIKI